MADDDSDTTTQYEERPPRKRTLRTADGWLKIGRTVKYYSFPTEYDSSVETICDALFLYHADETDDGVFEGRLTFTSRMILVSDELKAKYGGSISENEHLIDLQQEYDVENEPEKYHQNVYMILLKCAFDHLLTVIKPADLSLSLKSDLAICLIVAFHIYVGNTNDPDTRSVNHSVRKKTKNSQAYALIKKLESLGYQCALYSIPCTHHNDRVIEAFLQKWFTSLHSALYYSNSKIERLALNLVKTGDLEQEENICLYYIEKLTHAKHARVI